MTPVDQGPLDLGLDDGPSISAAEWTVARRYALRMALAGKVTWRCDRGRESSAFWISGNLRAEQPQPYRWLLTRGLIRLGDERPTAGGRVERAVTATAAGARWGPAATARP